MKFYVLTIAWLAVLMAVWVVADAWHDRRSHRRAALFMLVGLFWLALHETLRPFVELPGWAESEPLQQSIYLTCALFALWSLAIRWRA